ncbi:hypothetical protein U9M48_016326 [Paspalum notatum var. saurae]|uniref:Uncharacterized protein n=1 Tax=Paspalum notatum var. saurae TaxID=547442 RepID=A0AAQ3T629_PASNO
MPISLFVPNADVDDDEDDMGFGSSIFVMDRILLKPEAGNDQRSNHFEAFIYRRPCANRYFKSWHCHRLPLPPYIHEPSYWQAQTTHEISSYGVVDGDGGSHICISVDGVGTYCFHVTNHTWEKVGEWTLPFRGKLEYVPELKLWFGLSARDQHLAAADLSAMTMTSRPQIVDAWKELEPPDEWKECSDSQLVNLGSGRFCIARFFQAVATIDADFGNKAIDKSFAVLTGRSGGRQDNREVSKMHHRSLSEGLVFFVRMASKRKFGMGNPIQ